MSTEPELQPLISKQVAEIYWGERTVTFITDDGGRHIYDAVGDCCSKSRFHDFFGVENLLRFKILEAESVDLSPGDPSYRAETWEAPDDEDHGDYIQVYGFRFTMEHPDYGPVSAVMSFRNVSNGFYGGWMELRDDYDAKTYDYTQDIRIYTDQLGA